MTREQLTKANEIKALIEKHQASINALNMLIEQMAGDKGVRVYDGYNANKAFCHVEIISLEPWEARLIIHNKQQRIAALEKQFAELC